MNRLAAVLCLMVFIFPAIASANLLTNGDFENPTPGFGWYNWGDSGFDSWAGRDGSQGFALYGWITNGYGGLIQEVPVVSHALGDVYTFRLDGMAESGFSSSTAGVELRMEFWDGGTPLYAVTNNIYAALTSSAGSWNTYSLVWTNQNASVDVVKVLLVGEWFEMVEPYCAAMWDNASLDAMDLSVPWLALSGNESFYVGSSNLWRVTRNGSTNSALTVVLTNSNPFAVTVSTSVVIAVGRTATVFLVTGVDTGASVIGASAAGYQPAQKSALVSAQFLVLSGNHAVYAGYSNLWTVVRQGPSDSLLDVSLTSSAPLVLSSPASVTIAAGSNSASFYVRGGTNGSAVVTASAVGCAQISYTATVESVALVFSGSSSACKGMSNLWTLTRQGPVAGALEISLGSSPGGIASVPESVTVLDGENAVSFFVTGSDSGSATVTASAAGYPNAQKILVVQANQLSLMAPTAVRLGITSVWTVARTGLTTGGLTVHLAVDDAEVLSVPSTVDIGAGLTSATFEAVGLVSWDATVTASATDFIAASRTVQVSDNLLANPGFEEDASFGSSWFSWQDCGVELWAAESGSNGVALYGWMTNGYGGFGQSVPVVSHAAGDVYAFSIDGMAEAGFASASSRVELQLTFWSGESFKYAVTNNIYAALKSEAGNWNTCSLQWTNQDTSVDRVDVLVFADSYAPCEPYCAAMWDNASFELLSAGMSNLAFQGDTDLYFGGSNLWTITRSGADASPLTVALTSTNTQAAVVPASVIIPAGTNATTFFVVSGSNGTSVIKASATGYGQARARVAVSPSSLELAGANEAFLGFSNVWTVTRRGSLVGSASVQLSSSSPGVASVPASVVIPDGSASADVVVDVVGAGNATVSASATGFLPAARFISVSAAGLTLDGETTVFQGLSNVWTLTRSGPLNVPVTVHLSNSAPSVADVPAGIEMPAGVWMAQFFVSGTLGGTATVVASVAGYQSGSRSIVVKPNELALSGLITISRGGSNLWSVTRTGAVNDPLDVALESDAPSIASVPASVTISSGLNSAEFHVCGVAMGSATIRATATGYGAVERSVEVSRNLLRNPGFEEDAAWGSAWGWWGNTSVDSWAAEHGSNGVSFHGWVDGGAAGFYQTVDYTPSSKGDTFIFRLRGRADPNFNITGGALVLSLNFIDNGATVSVYSVTNEIWKSFQKRMGSWHGYSLVARNTNPAVDQVRVGFIGYVFRPTGPLCAAMWDNASLEGHPLQGNSLLLIGDGSEFEGASNDWIVVRLGSLDEELAVQLESDSPSVASVTPSVTIASGSDFAEFSVTMGGGAPLKMMKMSGGDATISASASGYDGTNQSVSSVANSLTLAGDASVLAPGTSQWAVSRSGPLESSVSVLLGSGDESVATVPASVEIAAGEASAAFAVVAVDSGSAAITAQATGYDPDNRVIEVQGAASVVDPTLESERPTLTWDGLGGLRYAVEQAARLDGPWTRKRDLLCNQDGSLRWQAQASDFTHATNLFYRVLTVVTNGAEQPYGP